MLEVDEEEKRRKRLEIMRKRRQQKILENAESRINKLYGLNKSLQTNEEKEETQSN